MGRILLAEDDDYLREVLKEELEYCGHSVIEAPNGKVARDIFSVTQFDLVVADIQLPYLTGLELLEWSLSKQKVPFVIITAYTKEEYQRQSKELGAKAFLTKPFKKNELSETISGILKADLAPVTKIDLSASDNLYCKVSIEEFVSRPEIDFDVYVKLSKGKYICIGRAGTTLSGDRIQVYREKGLKHLYILKDDFSKLVKFNLQVGKILKSKKDISVEKKVNFLKYTGEVILEKAFVSGINRESLAEAQQCLDMTLNVISEAEELVDLLDLLNSHADFIYAQSIATSMYSCLLAKDAGFESQQVLFKLSMAGMFHNIGLKEIDREILEKPRALLKSEERAMIESHPTRSKEILLSMPGIPEDVVQLAYEHHEDCAGQGFPRGINSSKMHPLSKIFQLSCLFSEVALKGPYNPEGRTAVEALVYIKNVYDDRVDPKTLRSLYNVLSADVKSLAPAI